MMQMLAAGGMPILSDGERRADVDNPRGYLEWERIKQLPKDPSLHCRSRRQGSESDLAALAFASCGDMSTASSSCSVPCRK